MQFYANKNLGLSTDSLLYLLIIILKCIFILFSYASLEQILDNNWTKLGIVNEMKCNFNVHQNTLNKLQALSWCC